MKKELRMYNDLRKYLSPYVTYKLVKHEYPKMSLGLEDMELERLRVHFEKKRIAPILTGR